MRPALIAVASTVALLAGCAHDEPREEVSAGPLQLMPSPPPAQITRYADENRDGKVSRDEAKADPALAQAFDQYDLDKDDTLDRGEFARLEAEARERQAANLMPPAGQPAVETSPEEEPAVTGGESLNRTGVDRLRR
jgi:hypothetical protein